MATKRFFPHPMMGGYDRSKTSLHANPETFYDMFNLRQSRYERGRIQQTPYFVQSQQLIQGTYNTVAGATVTDAASSSIRGIYSVSSIQRMVVTDAVVWFGTIGAEAQMPVYDMKFTGTGTGLNSACLVTINTPPVLSRGDSLDVQIQAGGTTFKWQKSGGGYSAAVPITTAGVSIDGGNVTVWFLTATGFTANDIWQFFRYDTIINSPSGIFGYDTLEKQISFAVLGSEIFFVAPTGRLFKLTYSTDGTQIPFVISVGYRETYTRDIIVFANHLFGLGLYSYHLFIGADGTTLIAQQWSAGIAWSDRDDPDNFFPTDVNEADTLLIRDEFVVPYYGDRITLGWFITRTQLFLICKNGIYVTSYYGLPTVFNFELMFSHDTHPTFFNTNEALQSVILGDTCAFLFRFDGVYKFDGGSLTNIGLPLGSSLSTSSVLPTASTYLAQYAELYILVNNVLLVYSERDQTWHRRSASFVNAIGCLGTDWLQSNLFLGLATRLLYGEDTTFANVPVKDNAAGTQFASPQLILHNFTGGLLATVKEIDAVYLGVKISSPISSANYTTATIDILGSVSTIGASPSSYSALGSYDGSTAINGLVSLTRTPFNALSLLFQVSGVTSTKATGNVSFYAIEPRIYNVDQEYIPK